MCHVPQVTGPGFSECALKGLANKPRKGDALMFYRWVLLVLCGGGGSGQVGGAQRGGARNANQLHGSCHALAASMESTTS